MSEHTDKTKPGPAGLYFNLRLFSRNAHIAAIPSERAAREALERWCAYCGQRSCYGFGETLSRPGEGVLTCSDPSCIASAEAEIARRDCPAPPAKPSKADAEPDLFGEAA